eukprot:7259252-Prymnesium_polylepis.1
MNVHRDPLRKVTGSNVENNTGSRVFTMCTLREIAVGNDTYDVVSANCHHAALDVYNACAAADVRLKTIPNAVHISMAQGLRKLGIDVAGSESRSGAVQSESTSVSHAPYASDISHF